MKYVVISPVRNEAPHLRRTVESMLAQTVPPAEWVIVDDGSTDETVDLTADAVRRAPWIKVIRRGDRGSRKPGAGVVEAFHDGLQSLRTTDWDLLVKLDGDLAFEPDYFARIIEAFSQDPKLGICGGDIFHHENGAMVIESKNDPGFHVRGANKSYRRACWEAMGGLHSVTGWDTLDEVKAVMVGWKTLRLPDLRVLHLKPTGSADGTWRNAFKNGRGSFICGYHPLFLIARSARRLIRGDIVESAGILAGYLTGYLKRIPQVPERELVQFLRTQQFRRVVGLSSLWR